MARQPRAQVLPGAEHVRIPELDAACEQIGEARATMNASRQVEQEALGAALRVLKQHAKQTKGVYKFAGVELVLVHGDDKVRARLIKEQGEGADLEGASEDDGA